MKKKIGILIVTLILIAIIFLGKNVIGQRINIAGATVDLKNAGDYRQFVSMTTDQFLNVTWDKIKGNFYTSRSEYGDTASSTRKLVCISQGTGDGNLRMQPVAVIDIEDGYVKAEGEMVNSDAAGKWIWVGDKAEVLARVAQIEGDNSVNPGAMPAEGLVNFDNAGYKWSDFLKEVNIFKSSGKYRELWTDHYGYSTSWYRQVLIDELPGVNSISDITKQCYNLDVTGDIGTDINDNIKITFDGTNTMIGPYTLKGDVLTNTKVKRTLTVTMKDNTKVTAELVKDTKKSNSYYIKVKGQISKEIKEIKIAHSYNGYKSKVIVMLTDFSQNRLVMAGKKNTKIEREVNLLIPNNTDDVSLQKYIVGVETTMVDTNTAEGTNNVGEEAEYSEVDNKQDNNSNYYIITGSEDAQKLTEKINERATQGDSEVSSEMLLHYSNNILSNNNIQEIINSNSDKKIQYIIWDKNNTFNTDTIKTLAGQFKQIDFVYYYDLLHNKNVQDTENSKFVNLHNKKILIIDETDNGNIKDEVINYINIRIPDNTEDAQVNEANRAIKTEVLSKISNYNEIKISNLKAIIEEISNDINSSSKEITDRIKVLTGKESLTESEKRELNDLYTRYEELISQAENKNFILSMYQNMYTYFTTKEVLYTDINDLSKYYEEFWSQVCELDLLDFELNDVSENNNSGSAITEEDVSNSGNETTSSEELNETGDTSFEETSYTLATDINGRVNKYAVSDYKKLYNTSSESAYNHRNKDISNHTGKDKVDNKNYYKINNPVAIEAGDSVTYKIEVYNNKSRTTTVTIADDFSTAGGPVITKVTTKYKNVDYDVYSESDGTINTTAKEKNGVKYWYDSTNKNYKYQFELEGNRKRFIYVTIKYNAYTSDMLRNRVWISKTTNTNATNYRTIDGDFVKMKPYAVSLKKFVSATNGVELNNNTKDPKDKYAVTASREANPEDSNTAYEKTTNWDNNSNTANTIKYDNPVTISNGDFVTYTIKVRNDSNLTQVRITKIEDILPEGIDKYKVGEYSANIQDYTNVPSNRKITIGDSAVKLLATGEEYSIKVTVRVTESNMSTRILRNTAEITEMTNKNSVVVQDTTGYNNFDADYFILNYPYDGPGSGIISGMVWNDTNRLKDNKEEGYNSLYDNVESKLSGIKVYLYRTGLDGRNSPIANATTDSEGKYSFADKDIYTSIPSRERHIKGPTVSDTVNRWNGKYYSYYIVFEYDGIKYTSTPDGQSSVNITDQAAFENGTYQINSNAKESDSKVKESRANFNSKFTKINKDSDIEYDRYIGKTSIEGQEYNIIPQSIHKYNESKMSMQSATNVITLANNDVLLQEIKYINLGLRGRDTLDLNVKTDIDKISVQVNGVTTDYAGKNSITVRKSDLSVGEDAANFKDSVIAEGTTEETQDIRQTDLVKARYSNYSNDQLLQAINVTYKITVSNESKTGVSEVSIIDYYDSRYDFKEVKVENCILDKVDDGSSSSEYNSKIITTKGNGTIYVTYELKSSAISTLKGLNIDEKLPTYNMAEIYEYTSAGENEYTRGLIDIDSAPGSVASEKVILSDDYNGLKAGEKAIINEAAIASRPTTLQYYFNKTDLQKINYEDDTGVKAVIFRVADDPRTIVGKVFRDNTTVNSDKIKTGNGKFDDGEDIVAGATVQLVEYNSNKSPEEIAENEGKVIFSTTTNKDGEYTFYGYIPGNYIIRYSYGNNDYTVLKNKFSSILNKYSYNGEDYQATNNTGSYGSEKLEHNSNFWYISNEQNGVSTATDNKERRGTVSTNVTNSDSLMTLLNDARDGKELSNENVTTIKNDTYMYASTYMMRLTGEKADENGNVPNVYGNNYRISNMNFGIAEVPVTTIELKSSVKQFTIKDAAGDNVIAKITKQSEGEWKVEAGNVLAPKNTQKIDVSIEEQKLQGAKMEVTYDITVNKNIEKNYDGNSYVNPVINGIVDFVDNNLSYNSSLGENSKLWETTTLNDVRAEFAKSQYKDGNIPTGTVVKADTDYVTILKTTNNNPLLSGTENVSCDLVLEKTLSSNDATVEDIITSNIETFDYQNKVEILGLNYANNVAEDGSITFRDRVRTADRHIILAGSQYDYAESEVITIHPPTGNNNNVIYYVISIAALGVLAVGIVLIKKFAINKD